MDDPRPHPPTAEHARLAEATGRAETDLFSANPWYEWGPYLSERAWGTVREDYSADGDAWRSFPHDHARSRAYRWNEDGMAGISDLHHELCLGLALWNGRDPILKERMFGLAGPEGNHGEDAKEYWWYLEGLPSHALLHWRYHYPQDEFPYGALTHHGRGLQDPELELLDTGVFDDDRYWSVDVTYAKATPTEVLMRVVVENHGPDEATLDVLPTLWFRNTWSWDEGAPRPRIEGDGTGLRVTDHALAGYRLDAAPGPGGRAAEALFCENDTNLPRLFGAPASTPYPKDGINDHVVSGAATVNPAGFGTKAALRYRVTVPAGGTAELRLRLHRPDAGQPAEPDWAASAFDDVVTTREREADEFYAHLAPDGPGGGAAAGAPPGERRSGVEQADLPLRRGPLARRRPRAATAAPVPGRGAQRRLAAPRLLRRAGDARPVGVPVVRRVGPRVPRRRLGPPRPRVRQVPDPGAAARVVPAPQRRPAGLRVELRRRQPARARAGGAARLPDRRLARP